MDSPAPFAAAVSGEGEVKKGIWCGGGGVAVPFVVIRADNGRWLVTEVELERLTG